MSIMTDIRDRLMASGDTEAAHALDHACFAARDRLDALDEMRKDLAAKDATIAEQAERIAELQHDADRQRSIANEHVNDNIAKRIRIAELEAALRSAIRSHDKVPENIPMPKWVEGARAVLEGIKVIDPPPEAIAWAEGVFVEEDDKASRISELEATVAEVAEVLEPFAAWKDQMENHPHVLSTKCTFDDDDLPFTVTPEWRHLRKAAALREKIMDLCHAAPVPGCEPSSAAPRQSDDGEARCDCHLHETQVCDVCQGIATEQPQEPQEGG